MFEASAALPKVYFVLEVTSYFGHGVAACHTRSTPKQGTKTRGLF
jgi:hypothetical protein